jgi:uncharacterized protein YcbX
VKGDSSVRVAQLWRYPVKSLRGEMLTSATFTPRGIFGDRSHAIFDTVTGFGLTARRAPEMLFAAASLRADGTVQITLPDGSIADDDSALSDWLGRPVQLRSWADVASRSYENPSDVETEATDTWQAFTGASGAFHDTEAATVTLLSHASIGTWEPPRFRANVLLDGAGEDELVGSDVRIGDAQLSVSQRIERCVMITRPQPGGIEKDLDVLRTIRRERAGLLAVGCAVTTSGGAQVGDELCPIG